jgi:hypothetical protein
MTDETEQLKPPRDVEEVMLGRARIAWAAAPRAQQNFLHRVGIKHYLGL